MRPVSVLMLVTLLILMAFLGLTRWEAGAGLPGDLPRRCALLTDVSGSTVDVAERRAWLLDEARALVRILRSVAPSVGLTVIAYDEEARVVAALDGTGPGDTGIQDAVAAVEAAMRPRHWTNPAAAFEEAATIDDIVCTVHLTDGTLDLPPAVVESGAANYSASLLAQADEFGRRNVPIITIALSDSTGDLWRQVADRTGGAYLVSPDEATLARTLESLLPAAPPSPTPAPSPTPQPPASLTPSPSATGPGAGAPDSPGGGFAGTPVLWVAAAPAIAVAVALTYGLFRLLRQPRLAGWLETEDERHD
jgi:hypothetical protein